MRQAWFLALRRCRLLGVILAGGVGFTGLGCHQHYHYYGSSACGPTTTTTVCEDGTQVVEGGTKVGGGPTISSSVSGSTTRSPRVVVSEPPRNSWNPMKADSDGSVVTSSVEGALNNTTIKQ